MKPLILLLLFCDHVQSFDLTRMPNLVPSTLVGEAQEIWEQD